MELIRRIYRKYREGRFRALAASTVACLRSESGRYRRELLWAHLGVPSLLIGRYIKTLAPPILVLSNPRSGSSWVGETLGNAANALYLREPITQGYLHHNRDFIFRVDPVIPDKLYKRLADLSFKGIPYFPDAPGVVKYPSQWALVHRRHRHLVIKEVNPLACEYFLRKYHPRVIFLVRHPAAVALSHRKLGWWKEIGEAEGTKLSARLHASLDVLKGYDDSIVVRYEELCAEPLKVFRSLFNFACLKWDKKIEKFIQDKTSARNREQLDSTSRDSLRMIEAWKGQVSKQEIEKLRKGYGAFSLPCYQSPEEW